VKPLAWGSNHQGNAEQLSATIVPFPEALKVSVSQIEIDCQEACPVERHSTDAPLLAFGMNAVGLTIA
jgi:hypothetical protein